MTSNVTTRNLGWPLPRIQAQNRQRRRKIDLVSAAVFCGSVLLEIGKPDGAMDIVFVADREMRELNNRYLRRDYATDVLSFAYEGETVDGSPFLGEIVIAPDAAVRNAAQYGIKPEREIKKLMVHGILHLAGYDHETDDGIMQRTQAKLLRRRFFRQAPAVLRNKKVDM